MFEVPPRCRDAGAGPRNHDPDKAHAVERECRWDTSQAATKGMGPIVGAGRGPPKGGDASIGGVVPCPIFRIFQDYKYDARTDTKAAR